MSAWNTLNRFKWFPPLYAFSIKCISSILQAQKCTKCMPRDIFKRIPLKGDNRNEAKRTENTIYSFPKGKPGKRVRRHTIRKSLSKCWIRTLNTLLTAFSEYAKSAKHSCHRTLQTDNLLTLRGKMEKNVCAKLSVSVTGSLFAYSAVVTTWRNAQKQLQLRQQ